MKDWYLKPYFNRRDWILDHAETLRINANELALCLLIDFYNEHHMILQYDMIEKKLSLTKEEIDQILMNLSSLGYLKIMPTDEGILYDLTGLFKEDVERLNQVDFDDVFGTFEATFARPLSVIELQKIADFLKIYQKEDIINALRKADAYRKLNISYIEAVLKNHEND